MAEEVVGTKANRRLWLAWRETTSEIGILELGS